MGLNTEEFELGGKPLGAVLRAVRRHRRMSQEEVAAAIGVSRRTYLVLEAGGGRISIPRLVAFADATRSDRMALFAAFLFRKPRLAVRCADNKMMWLMATAADDFSDAIGEQLAGARPQELMNAFQKTFAGLAAEVEARKAAENRLFGHSTPEASKDQDKADDAPRPEDPDEDD